MLNSVNHPPRAVEGEGSSARKRWTARLAFPFASLLLFVLLAVVHTWPLATDPGRLSRNDAPDTVHKEWILAWDAHQLANDPWHLFDSNTFYPKRNTLAYSDHLFVQALMGAPLLWLGASPVLVYNLLIMAGLALTGWATSLVVERWTGNRLAGIFSGSLMAFNALTLTRFPQIQDQHMEFFPLALWALDRLLLTPRVAHAAQLAGWFVLQALTCGYLMVFTSLSLVAAVAARPLDWVGPRFRRVAPLLLLSVGLAALALTPFLLPYLRVSREEGFTRSLAEVSEFSAHLTDYLATGGRFHFNLWSHRFFDRDALFPGVIAAGLAVAALVRAWAGRIRVQGWRLPSVSWRSLCHSALLSRCMPRFAASFHRWLAFEAPFAPASWCSLRLPSSLDSDGCGYSSRKNGSLPSACSCFSAHISKRYAHRFRYRLFEGISPIFDSLRTGKKVIACFPFPHANAIGENVDCMLASTRFWQPILNGNSSFTPELYMREAAALDAFPEGTTLQYLRQLGVTHVIVFTKKLSAPRLAHLDEHPELVLWKSDEGVRIYVLE